MHDGFDGASDGFDGFYGFDDQRIGIDERGVAVCVDERSDRPGPDAGQAGRDPPLGLLLMGSPTDLDS